jgi:hypothetical protein
MWLRGLVLPSMDNNIYAVYILLSGNSNEESQNIDEFTSIERVVCDCAARSAERCHHALFILRAYYLTMNPPLKPLACTSLPCKWNEKLTTKVVYEKYVNMPLENVPFCAVRPTSIDTRRAPVGVSTASKNKQVVLNRLPTTATGKKRRNDVNTIFPCQDQVSKRAKFTPFSQEDLDAVNSLSNSQDENLMHEMKALLLLVKGSAAYVGWGKKYGA